MPYGPNTSRTNRLPHGFFEHLYDQVNEADDIIKAYSANQDVSLEETMAVMMRLVESLKRQRQSHLGAE